VGSIAQTILRYKQGKVQWRWIRQNAPKVIQKNFSPEYVARLYLNDYKNNLNKKAPF
jgi:hypothetical protein